MKSDSLPRNRNAPRQETAADSTTSFTDKIAATEDKKWEKLANLIVQRFFRKRFRTVVGLLTITAFVSLLHTDYSLESTLEIQHSGENLATVSVVVPPKQTSATKIATSPFDPPSAPKEPSSKNIIFRPSAAVSAAKQSSSETIDGLTVDTTPSNQTVEKFNWDGGDPESWMYNDKRFPFKRKMFRVIRGKDRRFYRRFKKYFRNLLKSAEEVLSPCRLDDDAGSCLPETKTPESKNKTDLLWLYNPLDEVRFWCGKKIFGKGATVIKEIPDECRNKTMPYLPYVYSEGPPPILNKGEPTDADMTANPIELFRNADDGDRVDDKGNGTLPTNPVKCPVPCRLCEEDRYHPNLHTVFVGNTNWTFEFTMEGARYYPHYHVRPTLYRSNIFYSTTSFQSEIPIPYTGTAQFNKIFPPVDFDKVIKGASFLAGNCKSHNKRERVVKALFESELRVDSIGRCLHNAEAPPGVDRKNKTAVMEQYLFHLAFENQNLDDYITEKLWGTLQAGTIPVYLGASNIREHVPENSIIVVEDFENPRALADYLLRLTEDRDLYESYHKWRDKPIADWWMEKYEFTKTGAHCRICKFAYARQRGLGWNHAKQSIEKPKIEHKTCRTTKGLIQHPFRERWLSPSGSEISISSTNDEAKTCSLDDDNRVIELDDGVIRRKVYDHDGVTDLLIDITRGESQSSNDPDHYMLRLDTPLNKSTIQEPRVVNDQVWWIQDDQSRVYVMIRGDGDIKISSVDQQAGTIEISIPVVPTSNNRTTTTSTTTTTSATTTSTSSTSSWVRVVTEDIDHFHLDADQYITYFGNVMMRDFLYPIESYRYLEEPEILPNSPSNVTN